MSSGNEIPETLEKNLAREYGYRKKDLPFITGQDCTKESFNQIKSGQLSMCVFKDTQSLAYMTKVIVNRITNKNEVTFTENSSYFNGVEDIPAYILPVVVVDGSNVEEFLREDRKEEKTQEIIKL